MKKINLFAKLDKDLVKFVFKLAIFMAIYYIFVGLQISASLINFLTDFTAFKASQLLNLFNYNTHHLNNIIFGDSFSIRVTFGCEGSEPIALFVSTLLASKSNYKIRGLGILCGTLILTIWNDFRVFSLYIIGKDFKAIFSQMHDDIFPFLSVIFSLVLFLIWLKLNKKYL